MEDYICDGVVREGMLLCLDWSKSPGQATLPDMVATSSSKGEIVLGKARE